MPSSAGGRSRHSAVTIWQAGSTHNAGQGMVEHSATYDDILERIARLEAKVDALTEAFAAGRGALRMLFVLGSIATALTAVAASLRSLVH